MKKLILTLTLIFLSLITFSCVTESDLTIQNYVSLKKDDSTKVKIGFKESILVNDDITISFVGVNSDSRCPIDVICVWAGDAEIVMNIKKQNLEKNFILHSFLYPRTIVFEQYQIELKNVFPQRKSNVQLQQSDYFIELNIINHDPRNDLNKVHIIDENLEWTISKDYLKVNSAFIEKNLLSLSLSYSGGCKDHFINVFSYNTILKSIPPQLTFQISHNANNDICEAYITRKMQFDLSTIKNLSIGYNTFYINIISTDGNPINGSPFLYKIY